jgi:hypothetical protein
MLQLFIGIGDVCIRVEILERDVKQNTIGNPSFVLL